VLGDIEGLSKMQNVDRTSNGRCVLIEKDAGRRMELEFAIRAAGVSVLAVSSIAEVEEWPRGQLVITDVENVTPWWQLVGAIGVVALVKDGNEGRTALSNGATQWLQLPADPAAVASAALSLVSGRGSQNHPTALTVQRRRRSADRALLRAAPLFSGVANPPGE
jgi:hypothetical protein